MAKFEVGQEVGGFLIKEVLGQSAGGVSYLAHDQRSDQQMVMKTVAVGEGDSYQLLREYVSLSSEPRHRNLARIYGIGREGDVAFVAMEYIDGQPLSAYLEQRRERGERIARKTAFNILAHLCNGLQVLHKHTFHGALTPDNIYVTRSGRFKITNLAYGRFVAEMLHAEEKGVYHDSWFVAPELRKDPGALGVAADLYSIAMLAAELLTPEPLHHIDSNLHKAALKVAEDAGPRTFDALSKALSLDPGARFADAGALRESLSVLTEEDPVMSPRPSTSAAAAAERARKGDSEKTPVPGDDQGMVENTLLASHGLLEGESPSMIMSLDIDPDSSVMAPSLPSEVEDPFAKAARALGGPRMGDSSGDNGAQGDGKQYLVSREGLDYGPYDHKEVLAQLHRDEIDEHTSIMERTSQRRIALGEMPEFFNAVKDYIPRREERRRKEAEARAQRIHTVKKAGKWTGAVGVVAAISIFGVWLAWFYFIRPQPVPLPSEQLFASLGEEYRMEPPPREFAQVDLGNDLIKQLFAEAPPPSAKGKRRGVRGRRTGRNGGGGNLGPGDDDENISTFDMDGTGGSTHVLSDREIQRTIGRNSGRLGACLRKELKKNPGFKGVSIKFFIKPTGTTGGVKIIHSGASGAVVGCLKSNVRSMKFPAHGGFNKGVTLPFYVR